MQQKVDLEEATRKVAKMIEDMQDTLGEVQKGSTSARITMAIAVEANPESTMDDRIKNQIYGEAMGQAYARVIEARTHLDVALRALTMKR